MFFFSFFYFSFIYSLIGSFVVIRHLSVYSKFSLYLKNAFFWCRVAFSTCRQMPEKVGLNVIKLRPSRFPISSEYQDAMFGIWELRLYDVNFKLCSDRFFFSSFPYAFVMHNCEIILFYKTANYKFLHFRC